MTISPRERKLLFLVVPAVLLALIVRFVLPDENVAPAAPGESGSIEMARMRAVRMRQTISTTPARTAALKQANLDLTDRERGLLPAATAPQAQALLLEIARRVGKIDAAARQTRQFARQCAQAARDR